MDEEVLDKKLLIFGKMNNILLKVGYLSSEEERKKEYLECESLLQILFDEVNFCSIEKCDYKEHNSKVFNGCCIDNHGDGEELRAERISMHGECKQYSDHLCGYHHERGCKLKSHKPAKCISFICNSYHKYIIDEYKIDYYTFNSMYVMRAIIQGKKISKEQVEEFKTKIRNAIETIKKEKNKPK